MRGLRVEGFAGLTLRAEGSWGCKVFLVVGFGGEGSKGCWERLLGFGGFGVTVRVLDAWELGLGFFKCADPC